MLSSVIIEYSVKSLNKVFDYKIPNNIIDIIRVGHKVIVPFASKEVEGFVLKIHNEIGKDIDYKTIKNTQYERMGLELPYSWEEIYNESEAIRVQIREKEDEINNLLKLTEVK